MSVVGNVSEIDVARTFDVNENNQRTYTRVFQAITDSNADAQAYVANYVATNKSLTKGTTYATSTESDTLAVVLTYNSQCIEALDGGGHKWLVTFFYGPDEYSSNQNPINQPYEISYDGAAYTRGIDSDIYGYPVLNSAGLPYENFLEIDDSRPMISITRNEASFNDILADYYRDSVNADWFLGRQPNTVKVKKIGSRRQYDNSYGFYWTTNYIFETRSEGWNVVLLDQGYKQIVDGELVPILDSNGLEVTEAHSLDGAGGKLPQGGQHQYKSYDVYQRLPFSTFGF